MSAEDTEQRAYVCPTCGKQYLKHEAYAAHMKNHKYENFVSRDELKEAIKAAISEALGSSSSPAPDSAPLVTSATPPATPPPMSSPTMTTQGAKIGQFIYRRRPNMAAEDIVCPSCGFTEIARPLPVVEKEKPITQEVEVIPKGYIKAPQGGEDWLRILDLRHLDGKPIDQCPDCAKSLLTWFNQHKANLERASRGQ